MMRNNSSNKALTFSTTLNTFCTNPNPFCRPTNNHFCFFICQECLLRVLPSWWLGIWRSLSVRSSCRGSRSLWRGTEILWRSPRPALFSHCWVGLRERIDHTSAVCNNKKSGKYIPHTHFSFYLLKDYCVFNCCLLTLARMLDFHEVSKPLPSSSTETNGVRSLFFVCCTSNSPSSRTADTGSPHRMILFMM